MVLERDESKEIFIDIKKTKTIGKLKEKLSKIL
jgi:hypothetical protein